MYSFQCHQIHSNPTLTFNLTHNLNRNPPLLLTCEVYESNPPAMLIHPKIKNALTSTGEDNAFLLKYSG
jgi:hypothetical protein